MFFNLTTGEGFLKALAALNRWGIDAFHQWGWVIDPQMTKMEFVNGTMPLIPRGISAPAEKKYLEIQKAVAIELIKAGIQNNIGKTEIVVSERAAPDFAGIEAIKSKMDHYVGRVIHEIAGVPIEISKNLRGTISLNMMLSNVVKATSSADFICLHCGSENLATMLNGDYQCRRCRQEFSPIQVKEYYRNKQEEAEKTTRSDFCGACGRALSDPKWCSWCGSEPGRPEATPDAKKDYQERISAIEKIIEAGEPDLYRQARAGDQHAISQVFDKAAKEGQWKPLVGLGTAAVDFLIARFKDVGGHALAANALIEIGDASAVPILIEGLKIGEFTTELNKIILNGLGGPLAGHAPESYERLLKKLEELSLSDVHQPDELSKSLQFQIVSLLVNILGFAASGISADAVAATAKMEDVPVRLVQTDFSIISYSEDAYGHMEDYGHKYVTENVDCSSLRGAARRELKRRSSL